MKISYDENKRQTNLEKHGLDFADLTFEFFLSAVLLPAKDSREIAIGHLEDRAVIAVVFRRLGTEAMSVISMRQASQKERKLL